MAEFLVMFIVFYLIILSKCEHSNHTLKKHIKGFVIGGGDYADIADFPHAVCLCTRAFFCSSSVLNERVILTAAHCVVNPDHHIHLEAYAGNADLEKVTVIKKVSRHSIHENFNSETMQNDIAVLFLDEDTFPLGGNSPIKRVIIKKQFPFTVTTAKISGWGTIDDDFPKMSTTLKYTEQRVIPLHKCQTLHLDDWLPGMMCAGHLNSTQNRPTRADSGGGLMAFRAQLIGIVSFTLPIQKGLVYYTNISCFYDWIVKTVEYEICNNTSGTDEINSDYYYTFDTYDDDNDPT